jgi:hypothetical protein
MSTSAWGSCQNMPMTHKYDMTMKVGATITKLMWQYAARDNSLYPTFMKSMRRNARKRMVMNDAKLEVVDKYSDKIHGVARKFFKKFYRNYRFVGIRHFDDV